MWGDDTTPAPFKFTVGSKGVTSTDNISTSGNWIEVSPVTLKHTKAKFAAGTSL